MQHRIERKFEDHLTYPMVIGHQIREVEGRIINSWKHDEIIYLTRSQLDDIMSRIEYLEGKIL